MSHHLTDSDFHVLELFNRDLENARRNGIPSNSVRALYKSMYSFSPILCQAFDDDYCHVRRLAKSLTKNGFIIVGDIVV